MRVSAIFARGMPSAFLSSVAQDLLGFLGCAVLAVEAAFEFGDASEELLVLSLEVFELFSEFAEPALFAEVFVDASKALAGDLLQESDGFGLDLDGEALGDLGVGYLGGGGVGGA